MFHVHFIHALIKYFLSILLLSPVEAVQALVDAGANNRAQNNLTGASPLHMVAQSNKGSTERRLQVVDILLAAGADPSQTDKFGALPVDVLRLEETDTSSQKLAEKLAPQAPALIQAIETADLNAVQDCLPAQVGISFRDQTPVMHAVKQLLVAVDDEEIPKVESLVAILNALINAGADRSAGVAIESEDSPVFLLLTQLQIELKAGSETASLLKQAIASLSNSTIPKDGWQLLQRAARRDDLPFLKYLVEELDMNPNTKGRQGMTALQFAARSGRLSVLVRAVYHKQLALQCTLLWTDTFVYYYFFRTIC